MSFGVFGYILRMKRFVITCYAFLGLLAIGGMIANSSNKGQSLVKSSPITDPLDTKSQASKFSAQTDSGQQFDSGAPQAVVLPQEGDLSHEGGTPTIRKEFVRQADDPSTTNDESNDQPTGHFGTCTMTVTSESSGNTYVLDADVNGTEVQRVYFPKGGWVDFDESEIDADGNGTGTDEQNREWTFGGFVNAPTSSVMDEESSTSTETQDE
jgi:hypothetical protein